MSQVIFSIDRRAAYQQAPRTDVPYHGLVQSSVEGGPGIGVNGVHSSRCSARFLVEQATGVAQIKTPLLDLLYLPATFNRKCIARPLVAERLHVGGVQI